MAAYVSDAELDYDRLATGFEPGGALIMDEAYRRAHLPLVAPDHPKVIVDDPARGYRMGRHETIWSLVVPVEWFQLVRSSTFRVMQEELANGPLAPKIDWISHEKRRHVLHATIVAHLSRGAPPVSSHEWRAALRGQQPFKARLRGIFSGNINLGRLYLKLYPEKRGGQNAVCALQAALQAKQTDLYVVGLYNMTDDLDESETTWLAQFISRHQHHDWLEMEISQLHLLGARDDLALDSELAEVLPLG